MSYHISNEHLNNPLLKPLLIDLTQYFASIGIEFFIIGATARDIVFGALYNQEPARKTYDLDIAIAIPDWGAFDKISTELCNINGFEKDPDQKQRFHYNGNYELDIVPFGEVARKDDKIYWPPEESHAMSVKGFTEITSDTITMIIDNEVEIKVASLPGFFILKLIAWKDRYYKTTKDAEDMAYIIESYLLIHQDNLDPEHDDIYEDDDYTEFTAGAVILGRDLSKMLTGRDDIRNEVRGILNDQLEKGESSGLLSAAGIHNKLLTFDQLEKAFRTILNEISK